MAKKKKCRGQGISDTAQHTPDVIPLSYFDSRLAWVSKHMWCLKSPDLTRVENQDLRLQYTPTPGTKM